MAQQLIDQLMKKMAERYAEDFIKLVFPEADFTVVSTELDKELIIQTREIDVAIKILEQDREHIFHLEFQTEYDPEIPKRIFIYAGALTAKYHLEVTSVLFQLRPPPKSVQILNCYQVTVFGQETNKFSFIAIKLWEYQRQIISGKRPYRIFAPLLLELSDQPDEAVLRKERELILLEEDSKRRVELLGICLALASRHFDFNFLKAFFKEDEAMLEKLEEVPYIGEKIKEAEEKGRKKGRAEGKAEGKAEGELVGRIQAVRENIVELLMSRFGSVDGEIKKSLEFVNNPEALKALFNLALKIESLEAFEKEIAEIIKTLKK
ncbi:MAG: hypothetical protein ONB05_04965 [candidate division KSB1 bacterium]|nr:hypothetical protein [candidate division KSB1 bacterium]